MIMRFKYIFYLFAILSLLGPSDSISLYCRNVKQIRERGWVTPVYQNKQTSKCYHFRQFNGVATNLLNFKLISIELIRHYGKDVRTRLLKQTALFLNLSFIVLIFNKLYHHAKSILSHHFSYEWTISSTNNCLPCSILKDVRNIMWNSLLTTKWTNQEIQPLAYLKELDALQSGLHDGHT